MALLAIAEKCPADTRETRVRWDHIRDGMFGAGLNTAKAAVQVLIDCDAVVLVRPGYGNRHQSFAPTYRLKPLVAQPKIGSTSTLEEPKTGSPTVLEHPVSVLEHPISCSRATNTDAPTCGDSSRDGISDGTSDGTTKESVRVNAPAPPAVELSVVGNPQTANAVTLFEAESPTPVPAKRTARKKKPNTGFPEGWRPTDSEMAGFAAEYPALDIAWEFKDFELEARKNGRRYADWLRAFDGWLHRGGSYNKPRNGHQYANNDEKTLGWLTVGTNNTPALPQPFIEGETA